HLDRGVGPMGLERVVVIGVRQSSELRRVVRPALEERALTALDDSLDVVARDRLVGLERVGHREDLQSVLLEDLLGPAQKILKLRFHLLTGRALPDVLLSLADRSGTRLAVASV